MDTSEQYIKMCEKAGEIQKAMSQEADRWDKRHEYNYPYTPAMIYEDYRICPKCQKRRESAYCMDCGNPTQLTDDGYVSYGGPSQHDRKGRIVWLPRQDQLQEMVKQECPLELFNRFYRWIDLTDIYLFDSSMEQLWLAFVMHKKYGKTWNGEDWI